MVSVIPTSLIDPALHREVQPHLRHVYGSWHNLSLGIDVCTCAGTIPYAPKLPYPFLGPRITTSLLIA